jgi:hypothetical protein
VRPSCFDARSHFYDVTILIQASGVLGQLQIRPYFSRRNFANLQLGMEDSATRHGTMAGTMGGTMGGMMAGTTAGRMKGRKVPANGVLPSCRSFGGAY